jgi:hypothetical protein
MELHGPRDRREGPAGSDGSNPAADSPRRRFRQFLADRMGGVAEASWYLEQVMPRFGGDPEARLAAEELLDHLARLMRFGAERPEDAGVSLWSLPGGTRLAVALVDGFDAVTDIGRAARASEDLRGPGTETRDPPAGLLIVIAGEVRRRPIEQVIEVRRLSQSVRVVGLPSVVALARAVESAGVAPEVAAALLQPGVFADPLVELLMTARAHPAPLSSPPLAPGL